MTTAQNTTPKLAVKRKAPRQWKKREDCQIALFDKTLALLLEREESILGNILEECGHLVRLADEQATEVADMLDQVD